MRFGIGAQTDLDAGVVTAAVLGMAVAGAFWWLYFDVVALVAERRLSRAAAGRDQNSMARDSYSYLHFPMIAGIGLTAVGMKRTLAHVDDPLQLVPAVAMLGGAAVYLFAHVGFRLRNIGTFKQTAPGRRHPPARADPRRRPAAVARDARDPRRRAQRADHLRSRPLRRRPQPDSPPAGDARAGRQLTAGS
jgi:hypothetical protein